MKNLIKNAVEKFVASDPALLELSAHEQAISHRIAVYLEEAIRNSDELKGVNLNIDCEYNKHIGDPKRIDLRNLEPHHEEMLICRCSSCDSVLKDGLDSILEKHFRPDILVHSRGEDTDNLIAVEIKKSKVCPFDVIKLIELTKPKEGGGEYGYKLGVFVWFTKKKPQYKWFAGGEEVE